MVKMNRAWYQNNYEYRLSNRYISAAMIDAIVKSSSPSLDYTIAGYSVQQKPIYTITVGRGNFKILMWSQMHGNEATTTKALFDFLKSATSKNMPAVVKEILDRCTLCIIPQLNPDGATAYTRHNANNIDLNRDAAANTQPEMQILHRVIDSFAPHFCFNLHGQRTIYGFTKTQTSSSLSFLAPAADEARTITLSRKRAMTVITEIYNTLKEELPNGIGRYDDTFNINCIGDYLMHAGIPTVLYEAGHIAEDYTREEIRYAVFKALIAGMIAAPKCKDDLSKAYLTIAEHEKCFVDIVIANTQDGSIAIQYEERLEQGQIVFIPVVLDISSEITRIGHRQIDGLHKKYTHFDHTDIKRGDVVSALKADDGSTITLS